jgi:hypothetical protein
MRFSNAWTWLVAAGCSAGVARAQLEIVADAAPQCVFSGDAKSISATFHNPGGEDFRQEIRTLISQASSATVVPLAERPWKELQVLPQQTVLESVRLDFPSVTAETKFLVQWLQGKDDVLGKTEVLVYPTNLLSELKPLAGDEALGVFDPQNQFKPLLRNLKLDFTDLEDSDLENFSGRLAVVGPFQSKAQMREGLAKQIQLLAKKGAAIVWIQPPPEKRDKLAPSFYSLSRGTNAVVIVQPELVVNLPDNPQSQLNLIYFCKLALQPEAVRLPGSATESTTGP